MKRSFYFLIMLTLVNSLLFSAEAQKNEPSLKDASPYFDAINEDVFTHKRKIFPFVGCSSIYIFPLPGMGVSIRSNQSSMDVGVYSLYYGTLISCTSSKTFYKSPSQQGSYRSIGGGATILLDTYQFSALEFIVPLRMGVEEKRTFWDIGLTPGILFSPKHSLSPFVSGPFLPVIGLEIRGGILF